MTRFAMFQFALVLAVSSSISCSTSNAAIVDVSVGPGGALVFGPADVMIDVGDTVRWTWDSGGHNVGSGLPGAPTPFFLSGPPEPAGTTFEFLFDQSFLDANPVTDNIYAYHCHPHGDVGMIGNITVIPEPGSAWLASLTAILFLRMRRQTHASKRSSERTLPIRCL